MRSGAAAACWTRELNLLSITLRFAIAKKTEPKASGAVGLCFNPPDGAMLALYIPTPECLRQPHFQHS